MRPAQPSGSQRADAQLVIVSGLTAALLGLSLSSYLLQIGAITFFWRQSPISEITPEQGFAYMAPIPRGGLGSEAHPSPAQVLEDGVPLPGPGNVLPDKVRRPGHGRYTFWRDAVYFSSSDNSDPRSNGRIYEVRFPYTIDDYSVGAISILSLLTSAMCAYLLYRRGRAAGLSVATAAGLLLMILVMLVPSLNLPLKQRSGMGTTGLDYFASSSLTLLWPITAMFGVCTCIFMQSKYRGAHPRWYLTSFIAALSAGFLLLTLGHSLEANGTVGDWNTYYVWPDSGGYVGRYTADSLRPPVYPILLHLVIAGNDVDMSDLPSYIPLTSGPLLAVAQVQKLLLGVAALCAAFALMRLTDPVLVALLSLYLRQKLFISIDMAGIILSEALTQAWLLLLLAVFLSYLRKRDTRLVLVAGMISALMFLTRPAAAYSAIFPAVMVIDALLADWRESWRASALSALVTVLMVGAPILQRYSVTGLLMPAGMYTYAKLPFALLFATGDDVAAMPSEPARAFLVKALEIKAVQDPILRARFQTEPGRTYAQVVSHIYPSPGIVAVGETAANYALPSDRHTEHERMGLLQSVAETLLRRHWLEYVRFGLQEFQWATTAGSSRLDLFSLGLWPLIGFVVLILVIERTRQLLYAGVLALAHLLHLVVVSYNDLPIPRYIWATECLLVIAVFVAAWHFLIRRRIPYRSKEMP